MPEGSPVDGAALVALGLPAGALVVLLQRDDDFVVPQGRTTIRAGDRLLVLAEGDSLDQVRRIVGT